MCFLGIGDASAHLRGLKVLQELRNPWTSLFESGAGEQLLQTLGGKPTDERRRLQHLRKHFVV